MKPTDLFLMSEPAGCHHLQELTMAIFSLRLFWWLKCWVRPILEPLTNSFWTKDSLASFGIRCCNSAVSQGGKVDSRKRRAQQVKARGHSFALQGEGSLAARNWLITQPSELSIQHHSHTGNNLIWASSIYSFRLLFCIFIVNTNTVLLVFPLSICLGCYQCTRPICISTHLPLYL